MICHWAVEPREGGVVWSKPNLILACSGFRIATLRGRQECWTRLSPLDVTCDLCKHHSSYKAAEAKIVAQDIKQAFG